ncbi:hypothetical protein [Microbacterium sp. SLBN-146]|uniref:AAA family ATPase n=1 Tax=Microbacterium sp. SLBN-146 TaxID=2768457 RepID=UPI0011512B4B|nr:hypothetical protein [Microbacterium sp. SLBN-146]TQJ32680.1 MinD-like ATPase involved in chromosome partitioning or flagellar assembly [Microbacterium sp. SLBN-146]
MRVMVAVDDPHGARLTTDLAAEGIEVTASVPASVPVSRLLDEDDPVLSRAFVAADALVIAVDRFVVSAELVGLCDRSGVRIVPLGAGADAEHAVSLYGLEPLRPIDIEAWRLVEILAAPLAPVRGAVRSKDPRSIVVWGPAGAPGRSTVATELAVELARGGRRAALVDADSHAASLALSLGLPDEGPGFAAACRQAELGSLDAAELTRISLPIESMGVDVLTGINRPSRWPELSDTRVRAALETCRTWTDFTVVDVAASLERDEEIVSDLAGPRRNAATLAALEVADAVVAVVSADPLGISRFVRAVPDLRATIGGSELLVVANRLRPGTLGLDARGQVRRAIERFTGLRDVWFLPHDPRSADAALLAARPIAEVAPKSPLTLAVRRFVGEALVRPPDRAPSRSRRRRGRGGAA